MIPGDFSKEGSKNWKNLLAEMKKHGNFQENFAEK